MRVLNRDLWPHQVVVTTNQPVSDIDIWCTDCVGKRYRDWFSFATEPGLLIYAFKDKDPLLVFSITWNCKKL